MSNPLDILFFGAPVDANYARPYPGGIDYCKREDGIWVHYTGGKWERAYFTSENDCIERPKPKPWSGPEDGLPPIGLRVMVHECSHYYTKKFNGQIVRIVGHDRGDLAVFAAKDFIYHALVADKFKLPPTTEQIATEKRESAIRDIMDIAGVDCRVTAARLVDAGFKREGV